MARSPAEIRKLLDPKEHDHQAHIVAWCLVHPDRAIRKVHSTPNQQHGVSGRGTEHGRRLAAIWAARMKAEGLRDGYPDLSWPAARGGYTGLEIELKREYNGSVTDGQKEWLASLDEEGRCACVAWGAEQVKAIVTWYHSLRKTEIIGCRTDIPITVRRAH